MSYESREKRRVSCLNSTSNDFSMVNQMTKQDAEHLPELPDLNGEQKRRRRFLGAGAASTPFLLTLVSQPALGVTCFTPSRSLSKNTSVSQEGKYGECTGAESPGNYNAQQDPNKRGGGYHWPASVPPTTPMHSLFYMGNIEGITKFTKVENGRVVSMTLGEALNVNAPGQVHFHLIGAYLNKMGGNGAVIPDSAITSTGILVMWQEFATKGYYEPMAGVKWYEAQIVDYLKSNGIVK